MTASEQPTVEGYLREIRDAIEDLEDLAGDIPRLVDDAWSSASSSDVAGVRGSSETDPTSAPPTVHARRSREALTWISVRLSQLREELRELRREAERPSPAPVERASRPSGPALVDNDRELREVHATRFRRWLDSQRSRDDEVGRFADWWLEDRCRVDAHDLTAVRAHLDKHDVDDGLVEAAERAYNQWKRLARTPSRR